MQLNWPQPSEFPTLESGDIHVWAVPLGLASNSAADALELLSVDEIARAKRFVIEKPRVNFVASRRALRTLLGRYLNQAPGNVAIVIDANGKPRLADGELQFNLAHSNDLALIAVTRDCEVGVDVEAPRPIERLQELARRYFHPEEIAVVAATAANASREFLRIWTRKEAVLKAQSAGLRVRLDGFSTLSQASDGGIEVLATRCYLQEIHPAQGYVAAVATLESRRPAKRFTYSL